MNRNSLVRLIVVLLIPLGASVAEVSFEDDDLIVFVGNAVVERAQNYGYFELELMAAAHAADLRFRNLGWKHEEVPSFLWTSGRGRSCV